MQAFLEKQSPTVLSVLLHAAVLFFLWTQVEILPREPERPQPIAMEIVLPLPENTGAGGGPDEAPAMSAVQRTTPNPSEQPANDVAATAEDAKSEEDTTPTPPDTEMPKEEPTPPETTPREIPTPQPATPDSATPTPTNPIEQKIAKTPLDPQTLEQFRTQQEKTQSELEARKSKIMTHVAGVAPSGGPGVKRSYTSAGGSSGVVRELDISSYPPDIQERFKARWGITIDIKRVTGGPHQSYVNAVMTDRGTYLNSGGTGVFEVMTLSKKVLARMAELEEQELRKRNLDPLRSRVLEVVFGLREDDRGQVDIVITRFRAEPIQ